MSNYTFLNLSPSEFEDLSRDLLQKEWNSTLETFTEGRDNGIDLRYSSDDNNTIIQCKRYSDFNNLLSNLKLEKKNVVELNPDRYVIVTSVALTPPRKDQILEIFQPYIKTTNDILGKNDLNNLLNKFPEVEKQHFKLWLSSTTILDRILHSKVYNQSNFEIETIEETVNVYVDNASYYDAINIIKDKKYVIISGIPGIGKTTLARVLVFHYLANGFEDFIYLSDSINDGYNLYKDGKKQVFLFDDFLGTNFLENKLTNNEEQRIVKFIDRVSKSNDKLIIFTTREYILAQAKQKYDAFNDPSLEFAKCIIDLSQYTKLVKAKILYNHLFFSNISTQHIDDLLNKKTYISIINHRNYNPRIIQTITKDDIWKSIQPIDFSEKFLEFLTNPKSIWKHVFENQISKLSQVTLLNLMACGTPILAEDLKIVTQNFAKQNHQKYGLVYSDIEFKKTLRELENTFIKISKDRDNILAIEYQNPSVQDFLVFYFKDFDDYIQDILNCSNTFNQLFRIFSFKKSFTFENRIQLSNENIEIVINKLINEFDYLNSTTLNGSTYKWSKDEFSDYTKLDYIISNINIYEYPNVSDFTKNKFISVYDIGELEDSELGSFIRLIEEFQEEIDFDERDVINECSNFVNDINDLDLFERLDSVYPNFNKIVMDDSHTTLRIQTILELEAEHSEDDLELALDDLINRAKRYKIDESEIKKTIEEKIKRKEDEEEYIDWDSRNNTKNNQEADDKEISNIFKSLKAK